MAKLSVGAIKGRLARLKGWKHSDNAIQRQFAFKTFKEAMFFVNSVAAMAEQAGHHPDIAVSYNKVILTLSTHDAGGVTSKDFALAGAVQTLV
jgi:4a-hydroxytetrahydrobiopterin dehydratase